ncbi:MAG: hypothetical protein ACXABH_01640 [Candidatus Thorarchaeota archaeon]|jgi:hypothetical protein
MQWKKMLFATIIGIILFITDMNFGWMSSLLGGVWTVFIIVFIVGILAGDISGGFVAGFLTLFLGVGILAVIPGLLNPEFGIAATDILSRMWLIMGLSLSYSARFPDAPVPWVETLVIVILLILLAPFVFAFALLFGPIGGLFGRFIYPRIFKPEGAPVRASVQAPQQAPPPAAPEPLAPIEVPQEEVVEEEPEESSGLEPEPSE